jgi:hypothetical protein
MQRLILSTPTFQEYPLMTMATAILQTTGKHDDGLTAILILYYSSYMYHS